jgi:hypothetical protein
MRERDGMRHGDIFRTEHGYLMIYIASKTEEPAAYTLTIDHCYGAATNLDACLCNADVLYNICERSIHWYEPTEAKLE